MEEKSIMKQRKTKLFHSVLALIVIISLCLQMSIVNVAAASSTPSVRYSLHVQNKGWMNYVSDGATGGTTGQSLQAEAVKIQISGMSGGITYRTHIQNVGWTSWSSNNNQSGTTGRNLRMEAIQIKLTGAIAANYDVYYRVHLAEAGWLGWTKNGNTAGSTGCAIRVEAIQIKLSLKRNQLSTSQSSISKPAVKVRAHVQNIGWQNAVGENQTAGTTGKGYRLEALQIQCPDFLGGSGIQYRAHVEDEGWQSWKSSGNTAGTSGKSKRMEAVEIRLTGVLSGAFDVYYRAHCADYGWLGWACNGESAGTTGGAKQMEAIQVKLVPKNESVNKGGKAYYDLTGTASSNTGGNNQTNGGFQMPLSNARCSWRSSSNWSWGENRNGGGYSSGRVYHLGVDLLGSSDTVYATASGNVVRSGWNNANGNYVVIQHTISGSTVYSFYAHLKTRSVAAGTKVEKGQQIGIVGNTGSSSAGKHLHFAMMNTLWNGSYYGYSTYFTGNAVNYQGVTYYNPVYIIQNGRLP